MFKLFLLATDLIFFVFVHLIEKIEEVSDGGKMIQGSS